MKTSNEQTKVVSPDKLFEIIDPPDDFRDKTPIAIFRKKMVGTNMPPRYYNTNNDKNAELYYTPDHSYFVHGECGVGKTYHVCVLIRELCRRMVLGGDRHIKEGKIFFQSAPILLAQLRSCFGQGGVNELTVFKNYIESDFLFLDDLSIENITNYTLDQLFIIINERYNRNKHITITSNLSLSEISQSLGDKIASRLSQMCDVVHLKGKDKRLEKIK